MAALKSIHLDKASVTYSSGKDPNPFVAFKAGLTQGLGNYQVTLTFGPLGGSGVTSICDTNVGSFTVCNYILNGKALAGGAYQCCAHGDVAVASSIVPALYA